jgi:hypothetical protein
MEPSWRRNAAGRSKSFLEECFVAPDLPLGAEASALGENTQADS